MKFIRFTCEDKTYPLNVPVPAKKMIPQWYKDGETFYVEKGSRETSAGLKTCMPFLDILTAGYLLVTPFDIYVGKKEDGSLSIEWNSPEPWKDFVNQRPHGSGATIPRPAGPSRKIVGGTKSIPVVSLRRKAANSRSASVPSGKSQSGLSPATGL